MLIAGFSGSKTPEDSVRFNVGAPYVYQHYILEVHVFTFHFHVIEHSWQKRVNSDSYVLYTFAHTSVS